MNYAQKAMEEHKKHAGKWSTASLMPLNTKDDLSVAYTPGVAAPCEAIASEPGLAYDLTMKGRTVAVVSDGTSVLGLGDIGPMAGLPVMEGKAVLYKKYADIDAVPIVLASKNVDDIVQAVKMIAPTFGGIHLEDIAAPACFEIERRLTEELDIPVMHDDQHATAIVTLAGLYNALKVVGKTLSEVKIVISGAGAAGLAIARLLFDAGARQVVVCDSKGVINEARAELNGEKRAIVELFPGAPSGDLASAMAGSDVFIGVSRPGVLGETEVRSMAEGAVVFALANPTPEIMPDLAKAAGAAVVATGRSDFSNQINNVLVYPGLFRGLLTSRSRRLTVKQKLAAAGALAGLVAEPTADLIIPSILEVNPAPQIAAALAEI